jgi:hypothetical protein
MVKGVKKVKLGSKYPKLWRFSALFSTITFLYYLFFSTVATQVLLGGLMLGGAAVTAGALMSRDSVNLSLWVKGVGIVKKEEGRFRVVLAGESSLDDSVSSDHLSENFAELTDCYNRYFINYHSIKGFVKSTASVGEVLEVMNTIQSRIDELNKNFESGAMNDNDYSKLVRDSEKQRANALLAVELLTSIK